MCHQHAVLPAGRQALQAFLQELVRQAMEAITSDAFAGQRFGQGEQPFLLWQVGMEGSVEAGHLRYVRESARKAADAFQVMRLVQGGEGTQGAELGQCRVIDPYSGAKPLAAVDDPMCDGLHCFPFQRRVQ